MTASGTRIFLVDDHPLVREWLGNLIRLQPDLSVCGEAGDAVAAMAAMEREPPEVAIVDLSLRRGSGLDLIKELKSRLPAVRVIVLSMHEEIADVERAFRAGARGYVMKRESTGQIIDAIRQVHRGEVFANPQVLARLATRMVGRSDRGASAPTDLLSDREMEVFRRLGQGRSTREIADQLGVGLKTVQTYCARIKEKLGLEDGGELSRLAFRWDVEKDR